MVIDDNNISIKYSNHRRNGSLNKNLKD